MTTPWCPPRNGLICRATLAIVALASLLTIRHAAVAAELAEQAKSLRMVPADAAYYSSSLRLKEQLDSFLQSNAYSQLLQIQFVQLVKGQIEFHWQQPTLPQVKAIREYVDSPEGQDAIAVLKEMFADEVFLYGGSDVTEWLQLFMEINSIQRTARLEAKASGDEPEEVMSKRFLEIFQERADDYSVPTMVWGFRIKDADRAEQQLDTVHGHLRNLLDDQRPELSAHLQRDQIAGHEFLTLRLDGSMIPWDQLREEADDISPEDFDKWREVISKKTLAIALGVIDDYVLLSIGESTDNLENFGQGPFLADHAAIKRLEKHAGERVVSITYLSEEVAKNLSSPEKTVSDLANSADEALEQAEVGEEQRKKIVEDIQDLNLAKYMPSPGETSAIAFLTDRGYEGFQYQTGKQPMMDSSKPLAILSHLGGSPLMCIASRSNDTVEDYDEAVAWLKKTAGHVEEVAEAKAEPEDWAEYSKYRDRVIALLDRLDKANRELIYPAMADNEGAFVVNASAESKQWTTHMPKSPKELPMLEFGMVVSVSDAESLRKGIREYCDVLHEAIALAREIKPDDVPEFETPKPAKRELEGGGKLSVFALPEEWGVDEQLAPSAGLPATAEKLLQSTPPALDTSLDLNRPAAMVVHFEFAKLIERTRPWIDYGLAVAMGTLKNEKPADEDDDGEDADDEEDEEEAAPPSQLAFQMGFVVPQFYQFLDVVSAVRSATSITYEEDGVWVTHSETHIEDLKK
jgi:hypothetical protein